MKTTTINSLHIRGYRGRNIDVTYGDRDTIISGDNGAGKSSTYNAFLWLLIGVDAEDNTNKNIFDNRIPDDPNNPKTAKVDAKLTIDGSEVTLTKRAAQVWKYDKSTDELVRVADTYRYYINGNEVTATEYKQFVADTFGRADGYLKLMLNPRYWEMLDTRSLRKYFAEIVGRFSEEDFKGDYADVLADIKKDGVEKVLKRYRDERKKYDTLADNAKSKLADAKAEIPSLAEIEVSESKADSLEKEKQYLDMQRTSLMGANDELVAKRKAEEDAISAKRMELQRAESDYQLEQDAEERKLVSALETAKENNASVNRRREQAEREIEDLKLRLSTEEMRVVEMRDELKAILTRTFDGTCSVCGNAYIGAERTNRLEQFRVKKNADIASKTAEGQAQNAKIAQLKSDVKKAEEWLNSIERVDTRAAEDALIDFRRNRKAWEVTDKYKTLTSELAELEQSRTEIPTNEELTNVQVRIGEIDAELKALYMEIGNKRGDYNKGNADIDRMKELIAEYRQQSATARKHEAQVLEWQREYAELVSKRVNENFKNVQVEMTAPNKSGGLEDVCKLRYNGVTDSNNFAAKIKIGIEIAQVFQKHFGVVLPLWIDNAESITSLPEHEGQRVMLRVEKGAKLTVTTKG